MEPMRTRTLVATLAGALLFFGAPGAAFAQGDAGPGGYSRRCGYTHYCSEKGGDYDSSSDPNRSWNCQQDPFRDENSYGTPCRYSEECTNYRRCED
jgi:hypothetical protein